MASFGSNIGLNDETTSSFQLPPFPENAEQPPLGADDECQQPAHGEAATRTETDHGALSATPIEKLASSKKKMATRERNRRGIINQQLAVKLVTQCLAHPTGMRCHPRRNQNGLYATNKTFCYNCCIQIQVQIYYISFLLGGGGSLLKDTVVCRLSPPPLIH